MCRRLARICPVPDVAQSSSPGCGEPQLAIQMAMMQVRYRAHRLRELYLAACDGGTGIMLHQQVL